MDVVRKRTHDSDDENELDLKLEQLSVNDTSIEIKSCVAYTFENEIIVAVSTFYCMTWSSVDGSLYAYQISTDNKDPKNKTKLEGSCGYDPSCLPMISMFSNISKGISVCAVVDATRVKIWDLKNGIVIYESLMGKTEPTALLITQQWLITAHIVHDSDTVQLVFDPWLAKTTGTTEDLGQKMFSLPLNVTRVDTLGIITLGPGSQNGDLIYVGSSSGLLYIDTMLPISYIIAVQCMDDILKQKWEYTTKDKLDAFDYRQYCLKYHNLTVEERLSTRKRELNGVHPSVVQKAQRREFPLCEDKDIIIGLHATMDIMTCLTQSECILINKTTKKILPFEIDSALSVCTTQSGLCFVLTSDLRVLVVNAFSKSNKPDVNSLFIEDGNLTWKYTEPISPQFTLCEANTPSSVWAHGYTNSLFLINALYTHA
jgi:hypothetical protein